MSVNICKTSYCQGCKFADLKVTQKEIWLGTDHFIENDISCRHEEACKRMQGIMDQQRDYILHKGVIHIPIKSVNDVEMEVTNDLVKKAIREAYDLDVILTEYCSKLT